MGRPSRRAVFGRRVGFLLGGSHRCVGRARRNEPRGNATAIAAGGAHTCALLSGGSVACWGDNYLGNLGNGTTSQSTSPVLVSGITTATAVAAGNAFSCAIVSGGDVACWGDNTSGALGNGLSGPANSSSTPVAVTGITTATAITAGVYDACALLAGGTIDCWGWNAYGELGTTTGLGGLSATPVAVTGITSATAVAARQNHVCARLADSTVDCWGSDHYGELGDGTSGPGDYSATPLGVSGITTATGVAAEGNASCALLASGAIDCWGNDTGGQLGNGMTSDSLTPVAVSGISTATAIAGGVSALWGTTCAIKTGGGIDCWGYNGYGELGNGSTDAYSDTPVAPSGITGATTVSTDFEHTCAVLTSGGVDCWGDNSFGQLGSTTSPFPWSTVPLAVAGLGGHSAPGAPTGATATPGNAAATVSWTAPASNGGSTITGYTVTSSPDGKTCAWTTGPLSCTVTGLTNGTPYTFTVTATNSTGTGAPSAVSNSVTPDVPPTAAITPLPALLATNLVPVHWGATPGTGTVTTYDVRYRRAAWNGSFGAYSAWLSATALTGATFSGLPGSTYCFSVRAHDSLSLVSAWTSETCTAVPLDDRSLSRIGTWTLGSGSAYYRSTYTRSSTNGAKLVRTGVVARQLAILVTTCRTCGTVRVYWGSTLLRTISLYSATTAYRRLLAITTFTSARSGTLSIRVISSSKPVIIDGVAIRRV
jgi:alpha-tubulin suppressor-like RCC1 family protein